MSELEAFEDAVRQAGPKVALVLGSGMGPVADRVRSSLSLSYSALPDLGATSVHGHRGRLTLGEWVGRPVLLFEGRLHFYEGHPWDRVVKLTGLAASLGVRAMLHTNAAGGIHDCLGPGSLMAIRDHLEWTRPFWWRHPGPVAPTPPRPSPYSRRLVEALLRAAGETKTPLIEGIYAALTGPCYETPAEIRALKHWGADAVGMSTAREVQAGFEAGMEMAGLSFITNRAAGLGEGTLSHEEVLAVASTQGERVAELLERFLPLAA